VSNAHAQDDDSLAEFARKAQDSLGLTFGRTMMLGNGDGLDLSLGAYAMAKRPDGGQDWQLKFGISYYFN
jgi:hypothetical protein